MARKQRGKGTGSLFRKSARGAWIAVYFDHSGKRREHSTRTTDRVAAERIVQKLVADTALRRDLVIDPRDDRHAAEGRTPLTDHFAAYFAHSERVGMDPEHLSHKRSHLRKLCEVAGISVLNELNADALERYLFEIKGKGRSARSVNYARQIVVAFYGWCVKTVRAESNPLRIVGKQDETRDRRRVRRPLTDHEMTRLLTVARERGRDAWYLAAAQAGLRKGDLQRLVWADVNFAAGTITISTGKAKRTDTIPMHAQSADALQRRKDAHPALPLAKVFPDTVTDETRLKDFLRAGIAREVAVLDRDGKPVMVGEGESAKPKTRIVATDDEGRVIDLHALRTTLGTQLARAGVTPQIEQRIMRHSDYRTTLKHYTVLGLTDTSAAMGRLPGVMSAGRDVHAATGTTDANPNPLRNRPQQYRQQLERETGQISANQRGELGRDRESRSDEKSLGFSGNHADSRAESAMERKRLELSTPSLQS